MKSFLAVIAWVGISALTLVGAVNAGEVVYEDDFAILDPAWGEASDLMAVKDNKMVVKPPLGMSQSYVNQGMLFDDVEVAAKVRIAKGEDPGQFVGLIFWGEDYENYYMALLTPDGRFGVVRRVKGRWIYPVSYRANSAVKKGVGEWNNLRIVTKGKTATVFINDQQVVSFKGQPPAGGSMVGVHGESAATNQTVCEFAELKVSK